MPLRTITEQAHEITQPIVLSVGSAVIFGLAVDEIIKYGTLTLMVLNIPLAMLRIHETLKKKKVDKSNE